MNRLTIALLGSLAVSIGCKKPPPPAAPVAAGPPAAAKPMPAQIPPVLARVNGEAINKWEYGARKMGPTDADVDARIAKIKGSFPNDDAFQKGIAAQGLTVDDLRAQAKLSLEVARFLEAEVSSKIAVTDGEVDAFYKQNLRAPSEGPRLERAGS